MVQEVLVCLVCTLSNGFLYVLWKLLHVNYIVVQTILQIFSTLTTTMPIIDTENLNIWPVLDLRILLSRLYHIENDSNPVFILLSNYTYVCVGSKRSYCSKWLIWHSTLLKVWQYIFNLRFYQCLRCCFIRIFVF